MNEADQFMSEIHLSDLDLHILLVDHLLKTTKGYKNFKKLYI